MYDYYSLEMLTGDFVIIVIVCSYILSKRFAKYLSFFTFCLQNPLYFDFDPELRAEHASCGSHP